MLWSSACCEYSNCPRSTLALICSTRLPLYLGAAVPEIIVSTPVLRKSPVFRVTTASPRVAAAAARRASGAWSSSASPRLSLSSMSRAHAWSAAKYHPTSRSSNNSSRRSRNRVERPTRRRPGIRRPMPSRTSHTVMHQRPMPSSAIESRAVATHGSGSGKSCACFPPPSGCSPSIDCVKPTSIRADAARPRAGAWAVGQPVGAVGGSGARFSHRRQIRVTAAAVGRGRDSTACSVDPVSTEVRSGTKTH